MENFKREEKESRKDKFKWLKVAAIAVLFVGTGIGMFYGGNIVATKGFILTGVPEKAVEDLGKISDSDNIVIYLSLEVCLWQNMMET